MIVFPHAKINIGLNIIGKREDGFHSLQSVFYPIPLFDMLEIVQSDKFQFNISGLSVDSAHLVTEAYYLLKHKFDLPPVSIHLHKTIPLGAGLGGGSSDGSFTLRLLNQIFGLQLSPDEFHEFSLQLGSDCPFFLYDDPKMVSGRGEDLTHTDINLSDYYIKLVNPGIHISTKEAFLGIEPQNPEFSPLELNDDNFRDEINRITNDFEIGAIKNHPIIGEIKESLKQEGAFYASMTGTGSTVYGLFKKEPTKSFDELFEFISQLKHPRSF